LEEHGFIQRTCEEWVEDACGNRDPEHVVGEGPEQVLLYVSKGGFTETYSLRHPAHVCADEREAYGLHTSCHPFHQQRNGMLVQSICNRTELPKVRRRLEE
jgi:hypothetical protein